MQWIRTIRNDDEEFAYINLAHVVALRLEENVTADADDGSQAWLVVAVQLRGHQEVCEEVFAGTQQECEQWAEQILEVST